MERGNIKKNKEMSGMENLTQRLRSRKEIQFSNELVEINGVWLACSGIRKPGYGPVFDDPGEDDYIENLTIRSINDKQDIFDILDLKVIDDICEQLVSQVEQYQEKED